MAFSFWVVFTSCYFYLTFSQLGTMPVTDHKTVHLTCICHCKNKPTKIQHCCFIKLKIKYCPNFVLIHSEERSYKISHSEDSGQWRIRSVVLGFLFIIHRKQFCIFFNLIFSTPRVFLHPCPYVFCLTSVAWHLLILLYIKSIFVWRNSFVIFFVCHL